MLYAVNPAGLFGLSGQLLDVPAALTDVRATYGGMQIGLGAYVLWLAWSVSGMRQALCLLVIMLGCVGSVRLVGAVFDGGVQALNFAAAGFELVAALLLWRVLRLQ